jgi:hypothetical protein
MTERERKHERALDTLEALARILHGDPQIYDGRVEPAVAELAHVGVIARPGPAAGFTYAKSTVHVDERSPSLVRPGQLTVPTHRGKEMPTGTANAILKAAGLK